MSRDDKRHRWIAVGAAVLITAGLAVGIAAAHQADPTARGAPRIGLASPGQTRCSDALRTAGAPPAQVRAFHAVRAVLCTVTVRRFRDGVWTVRVREQATAGLGALLRALDRPDESPHGNLVCAASGDLDPQLWLVDARGRYLHPRYPRDGCSHVLRAALRATERAGWQIVSETKIARLTPRTVPILPVKGTCPPRGTNQAATAPAGQVVCPDR